MVRGVGVKSSRVWSLEVRLLHGHHAQIDSRNGNQAD